MFFIKKQSKGEREKVSLEKKLDNHLLLLQIKNTLLEKKEPYKYKLVIDLKSIINFIRTL
jgi:hypothetical protein